jgi:hypothetical protein
MFYQQVHVMIPAREMYLRMVLNSALDIPEGKEHSF